MGEVWAARRTGALGVSALAAVKVALKEHADHDESQTLFFDEGRVAAMLDHPNVCKTYELGESEGALFLAMELIDGVSIQALMKAMPRPQRATPAMAAYIIAQACAGLHAAHELTDDDGTPLHVVHRDATPQNILLTINGDVKVIDFGVAKARNQVHATVDGEFKGKVNYLAPEQALAKPNVDRRADVFALGCVLYQMTTAERPFRADNAANTLIRILEHRYEQASSIVPDLPPVLDAIIEKALAHQPDDRFQTADEMRIALEEFGRKADEQAGRTELAALVRRYRGADLDARRTSLRAAQRRLEGAGSGGFRASSSFPVPSSGAATNAPMILPSENSSVSAVGAASSLPGARSRARFGGMLVAAAVVGVLAIAFRTGATRSAAAPAQAAAPVTIGTTSTIGAVNGAVAPAPARDVVSVTVRANAASVDVSLDGAPSSRAPHVFIVPKDGRPHTLEATAAHYAPVARAVTFDLDQTIDLALKPLAAPAAPEPARHATHGSAAHGGPPPASPSASAASTPDDPFTQPGKGARPQRSIDESDPF
jgi:serine/threonine-protein kinase